MNVATKRIAENTMVKLRLALLGDENRNPNVTQARAILDEMERQIAAEASMHLLGLDSITADYLERAGITTVEQVKALESWQLIAIDGITTHRALEIAEKVSKLD